MRQIIMKAAAFSFAIVLLLTATPDSTKILADADKIANENIAVTAAGSGSSAVYALTKPVIAQKAVYSGKLEISTVNLASYGADVYFEIELNGKLARTQSALLARSEGCLFTTVDGDGYLEPSTMYVARVRAVTDTAESEWSEPLTLYTNSQTYYCVEKGTKFNTIVCGRMMNSGRLPQTVYAHAVTTDADGNICDGQDTDKCSAKYIMFTDSEYEGCFILVSEASRVQYSTVKENKPEVPELELAAAYGDELSVAIKNFDSYDPETVFNLSVDGRYVKTLSYEDWKEQGCAVISNSASGSFAPNTKYRITVEAEYRQLRSSNYKSFTTDSASYYMLGQGKPYYLLSDDEFVCAGYTSSTGYGKGSSANKDGALIEGKVLSAGRKEYVKITEGDHEGCYFKADDVSRAAESDVTAELERRRKEEEARRAAEAKKAEQEAALKKAEAEAKKAAEAEAKKAAEAKKPAETASSNDASGAELSDRDAKIAKVCAYARSNSGGVYVFAGSNFRATDCSGLTMLSYKQIGVSLPHSSFSQANCGKRVSLSDIQPGDLIITNSYGHVMIYVGNGEVVHAIGTAYGIQTQKLSHALSGQYVNAVVRVI